MSQMPTLEPHRQLQLGRRHPHASGAVVEGRARLIERRDSSTLLRRKWRPLANSTKPSSPSMPMAARSIRTVPAPNGLEMDIDWPRLRKPGAQQLCDFFGDHPSQTAGKACFDDVPGAFQGAGAGAQFQRHHVQQDIDQCGQAACGHSLPPPARQPRQIANRVVNRWLSSAMFSIGCGSI